MSKREIKTIFLSIGTLSLIIEGEFLFKHDVSHLSFCSCRQVVPRHRVRWEHPAFLRTPEESTVGSELFSCLNKDDIMLDCDTKCSCL